MDIGPIGTDPGYERFPFFFNGKEKLTAFDLEYLDYGARLYDLQLSRWSSDDPLYQFASPYDFCGGDPVNRVDPDGRLAPLVVIGIGALIGAGAAVWSNKDEIFKDGQTNWSKLALHIGAGAVIGGGTAYLGPLIGGGFLGGAALGAGSGALTSTTSQLINNGGNFQKLNGGNIITGALIGGAVGGVFQGISASRAGKSFWTGRSLSSPSSSAPQGVQGLARSSLEDGSEGAANGATSKGLPQSWDIERFGGRAGIVDDRGYAVRLTLREVDEAIGASQYVTKSNFRNLTIKVFTDIPSSWSKNLYHAHHIVPKELRTLAARYNYPVDNVKVNSAFVRAEYHLKDHHAYNQEFRQWFNDISAGGKIITPYDIRQEGLRLMQKYWQIVPQSK